MDLKGTQKKVLGLVASQRSFGGLLWEPECWTTWTCGLIQLGFSRVLETMQNVFIGAIYIPLFFEWPSLSHGTEVIGLAAPKKLPGLVRYKMLGPQSMLPHV